MKPLSTALALLFPLPLFLGTASAGGHADAGPPTPPPFHMSVYVEWESSDRLVRRVLRSGQDVLHAGEHFRIHADSDQPVYLYFLETDPELGPSLLSPLHGHTRTTEAVRVPAAGLYRVEGGPGEYKLSVFASREPMSQTHCEALALRCPLFPDAGPGAAQALGTTRGLPHAANQSASAQPVAERTEKKESAPSGQDESKKSSKKESNPPAASKEPVEAAPIAGQSAKDGTRGGSKRSDGPSGIATAQSNAQGIALVTLTFHRNR